jgi:methylated-DNA-[protein]-cysteine S-methyltransferase
MGVPPISMDFNDRCYSVLKKVPRGRVTTYKEIAQAIGCKGAQRAVGNAMNRNPYAPKIPCHRVVKSNGEIGGFATGSKNKIGMLEKEGVKVEEGFIDLKKYFFSLS